MIDKIKCKNRIGNDIHKELIAMWNGLQKGWKPPSHITEEEYIAVRDNKKNILIIMLDMLDFTQHSVLNILEDMQEDLRLMELLQEMKVMRRIEIQ